MQIEEDTHTLILLGRPFLDTSEVIIHVNRENLTFKVGDDKIEFILSKIMKNPFIGDSCCQVDAIDEYVREYSSDLPLNYGLKVSLIGSANHRNDKFEMYKILLNKNPIIQHQSFELLTT